MKFSDMPYERIDQAVLKSDFEKLSADFDRAGTGEEQFKVHQEFYSIYNHAFTLMTIAEIRHDIDTTDGFYKTEQDYYDALRPEFQNLVTEYKKKLYGSQFRPYLEKRIGHVAFKNIELAMKSVDSRIIPLMQEENALQTRYNQLLASASIDWNGEKLNLSLMRPYLTNNDRNVRAKAWKKHTEFFEKNAEELDEIFDLLVKNRTEQGRKMGYDGYLPLGYCRMMRNCYDRNMVSEFRKQVKRDLVPYAEKLHEKRRAGLGIGSLRFYDEGIYFADGNPTPEGTPSQILESGRKMYGELSPETGEFMNFMCDNELFDVLGRKTKKTGGYMTYLPDYKSPFIFANFNATSDDVDVITHECGHAFQGYMIADDPVIEHQDITMETAETHSMSMEFFTEPWMKYFFGRRAEDYVNMHLMDAVCFIPYGTMVDEFQDIVYENPSLTPGERNRIWRELEREYKPHLDYEGFDYLENGGFWQKQHHIYDCPLYYIDYCIAQTDALQYRAWMKKDYSAAWNSYLKLCKLSASDFFTGLIKQSGLNDPFEDGCLAEVVEQLGRS